MTDERLRELLDERVADLTPIDLVSGAWDRAAAVRRRRRAAVGAGVAVVAVVGGTVALVGGGSDTTVHPAVSSPTSTAPERLGGPEAERDGTYGDAPVWRAPTVQDEADLPLLPRSALPETIDLSAAAHEVPAGFRAIALFQLWAEEPGGVVALGADGTPYVLDVSRLDPVTDRGGTVLPPVTSSSLSPDGRHAFFVQERSLEVYDFTEASWTSIPTDRWAAEGARWWDHSLIRVPNLGPEPWPAQLVTASGKKRGNLGLALDELVGPTGNDDPYGPSAWGPGGWGARAAYLAGPVSGATGVDAIAVVDTTLSGRPLASPPPVLTLPREPGDGRWLQCCPVVGWADGDTVLFESRHEDARILAWRIGTPDVFRVSDIRGWTPGEESYVASFAALD